MFPTNRIELVQDAADATIAKREVAEAARRYLKADGERTEAALDGGRALNRLKESTAHGAFGAVLKRLPIPERTAQRWMRLAGADFKSAVAADLGGIMAADRFLSSLKPGVNAVAAAQLSIEAVKAVRDYEASIEETIVAGEKALEVSQDETQRREIEALLCAWRAEEMGAA